ncbi:MAG: MFS transporter [Myxococcota bacterium]|nr:MFS transporter [Myxococcota bacterium]
MIQEQQLSEMNPVMTMWRRRIFASTWLCYVGLYFCRKPFYIAKKDLGDAMAWSASDLGLIGSAYLVAYAVGQFLAGSAGTKFGARRLLIGGMGVSLIANIAFGITNDLPTFILFMVINGLAQATGWAGTVSTMANWFRRSERGTVMGLWATCFQVGGVLANGLAAFALGKWGFQYSFFGGSCALFLIIIFFVFNQRNAPEDVGLELADPDTSPDPTDVSQATGGWMQRIGWNQTILNTVLLVGCFYFFVKFIRYALWSWVPYFLGTNYALKGDEAGYISTLFDLFGIAGCIAAGYLSDKYFNGRRAKISFYFLIAMGGACLLMYFLGQVTLTLFAISIALVGFTLYGPDALMTGAAAQDIGGRGTALAAGIINGMGSIGAVVQEFVISAMFESSGGDLGPVFGLLVGASVGAIFALGLVLWRNRIGISDV